MRIERSSVHLAAAAATQVSVTVSERLERWGHRPADPTPAVVTHASSAESSPSAPSSPSTRQLLVERLLAHQRIRTVEYPQSLATPDERSSAPASGGAGAELTHTETLTVEQAYAFAATAEVQTADGRALHVELEVEAAKREAVSSSATLRVGAPKPKDPLVLSRAGARLDPGQRVDFDLDGDGATESVASLGSGAAFLAIDRNGDGRIENGTELFGPKTGDGFTELRGLDGDSNGWIDEGDAAWSSLRLFRPGETPRTLLDANVGAIAVASVDTPFQLQGGALRATSLYLEEQGGAGVVQHVDLDV